MVTPKKRRTGRRKPDDASKPPAVINNRDDLRAEAELRAQGIQVEPDAPEGETAEERARREVEETIAGDLTLINRPQVRRLVLRASTRPVMESNGSPAMVVGPDGKKQPMMPAWDAIVNMEFVRALKGDEAARERVWNTFFGKPRESMELSGAGGGAIQTLTKHEGLSAEQLAERYLAAEQIVREIRSRQGQPLEIEAIEVGASVVSAPAAPAGPVDIPATGQLETLRPGAPAQQAQAEPMARTNTGMIPRR
jgi:hypothetical protein